MIDGMPVYIPKKDPRDQYLKIIQNPNSHTNVTDTKVENERIEPIAEPNPSVNHTNVELEMTGPTV